MPYRTTLQQKIKPFGDSGFSLKREKSCSEKENPFLEFFAAQHINLILLSNHGSFSGNKEQSYGTRGTNHNRNQEDPQSQMCDHRSGNRRQSSNRLSMSHWCSLSKMGRLLFKTYESKNQKIIVFFKAKANFWVCLVCKFRSKHLQESTIHGKGTYTHVHRKAIFKTQCKDESVILRRDALPDVHRHAIAKAQIIDEPVMQKRNALPDVHQLAIFKASL